MNTGSRKGRGGEGGGGEPKIRGEMVAKENFLHDWFSSLPIMPSAAIPFGRSSVVFDRRVRACTLQRGGHVLKK